MQTKIISSPVRTIQLDYEEEKPFSEYENELIARYVEMHNIHAKYEESVRIHEQEIDHLHQTITETKNMLGATKKQLNELLALASSLESHTNTPKASRIMRLEADNAAYNRDVGVFYKRLCNADEENSNVCNKFADSYDEWQDKFEEQLGEFSDFEGELYTNEDNYQLDSWRFFRDHEEFKECLQVTDKKMEKLYASIEEVEVRWQELTNEATLFFDFVNNQKTFRGMGSSEMRN
jgi:hypothetical protein